MISYVKDRTFGLIPFQFQKNRPIKDLAEALTCKTIFDCTVPYELKGTLRRYYQPFPPGREKLMVFKHGHLPGDSP